MGASRFWITTARSSNDGAAINSWHWRKSPSTEKNLDGIRLIIEGRMVEQDAAIQLTPSHAFPACHARHSRSSDFSGLSGLSGVSGKFSGLDNWTDGIDQIDQIDPLFVPLIHRLNS
jgi:hypothetical protein